MGNKSTVTIASLKSAELPICGKNKIKTAKTKTGIDHIKSRKPPKLLTLYQFSSLRFSPGKRKPIKAFGGIFLNINGIETISIIIPIKNTPAAEETLCKCKNMIFIIFYLEH